MKTLSIASLNALACCSITVFLMASQCSPARSDEYFNQAMDRIEQTLVRPAENYGLTVTDRFTNKTTKSLEAMGELRERWGLITDKGRLYYRIERFDPKQPEGPPYFIHVTLRSTEDGEIRSAVTARGRKTLSTNLKPMACGIGQIDGYVRSAKPEEILERPDKQPVQILTNPCFAPLEITPVELRTLPVVALPDQDGHRVYEVARQEHDDLVTYRFYFAPQQRDALARTDKGILRSDRQGYLSRTTRQILTWQALADGTPVPERFTLEREENGRTVMTLTRIIETPRINDIPDQVFDAKQIPEFQGTFDLVQDPAERIRSKGKSGVHLPAREKKSGIRLWLIALNGVVIAAIACLVWQRRRRSAP